MALEPFAKLPAMKDALAGSDLEDNAECIQRVFDENNIATVDAMDNSPRYLTCSICGISTHRLIQQVRAYMEGVKEGSIVIELIEEVIEEPEPKEVPAKPSKSRSRSSGRKKKE